MDSSFPNYPENLPSLDNRTWLSELHPKYDFMEGMMWLANESIAGMFPSYSDFKGFQLNKEDLLSFNDDNVNINDIIWKNSSAIPFIVVGIIYFLVIFIGGIVWCCCKFCCAKKSCFSNDSSEDSEYNHRSPIYEEDYDDKHKCGAAKITCNVFMGSWLILFLFLLISSFAMNITINEAIDDIPGDIDNSLTDAEDYLQITKEQFHSVFVTSFANLTEAVQDIMNNNGRNLPNYDKLDSETEALKIQNQLVPIKGKLEETALDILHSIELLESNGEREVSLLTGCFKELQSVNNLMENLKGTLNGKEFSSASNFLNHIGASKDWINPRIDIPPELIERIKKVLEDIGNDLKEKNRNFADAIEDIPLNNTREKISDIEEEMDSIKPYLYNTMWVVLSILVVILVMIVVGTVIKALGHSQEKGFLKTTIFFNSGMVGIFITGFFLMLLCLVLYVLSGFAQVACQGIRDLEKIENRNSSGTKNCTTGGDYVLPLYEDIVESCKLGRSAYLTLDLCQIYDIQDILNLKDQFPSLRKAFEELSHNHLETTLSTIKNPMQGASDDLKELLLLSNSFIEDVQGKTISNIELVDTFKSFEKHVNNITKKISSVERNLVVLGNIQESSQNRQSPMDPVLNQVNEYSIFVYNTIMYTIGECKPMYDALDATIDIFCYKVAFPVAGFWLSLAFLLLLYIPVMITIETLQRLTD